jgi:hypothetical protein
MRGQIDLFATAAGVTRKCVERIRTFVLVRNRSAPPRKGGADWRFTKAPRWRPPKLSRAERWKLRHLRREAPSSVIARWLLFTVLLMCGSFVVLWVVL